MKYTKPTLAKGYKPVIINVVRQSISQLCQDSLKDVGPEYLDTNRSLEEDLYGELGIENCIIYNRNNEFLLKELAWIKQEMRRADAAYVRFIKM